MLHVERLEKVIEMRRVLSIDQLDVQAGEIIAVVGPVGSGKSLLISLLSGQIQPSAGCVTLNGQDMFKTLAARIHIGLLLDADLLYERHTAQANIELYANLLKLPKSRVSEVLTLVGLSDQAEKRITKLSSPAQRRLAFARMMLAPQPLWLLDHPTVRADGETQTLFAMLITQAAAKGTAILLTEEDLSWAGKFCTRVVELIDGRIIEDHVPQHKQEDKAGNPVVSEQHIPFKVPARKEDRILLYDPGDLLYATSRDGKTFLRTANDEAATNLTLQELESRLVGRGFFKAHRAYLVNLQHIRAVIQYTRNSYTLLLNDDKETMIPLSKQCEKELQELLGY